MLLTGGIVVVLVVLIIAVASVVGTVKSAQIRERRGLRKDWLGSEVPVERIEDGKSAALQNEVTELRERVKVLERIVIEGHGARDVAQQIENLRDR